MIIFVKILVRIWCWLELVVFTLVLYGLSFLPAKIITGFYESMFHSWCRAFVRAMGVQIRLHQHYRHQLPASYIVIANHPSAFEDIGIPAIFQASSVAKMGVRDWFLVGRISAAAGTIFVKRDDRESRSQASRTIVSALQQGRNIAIYPEGGCFGRRINPFLYGIFSASLETGVPIVPVFIHYEAQADFEWQGQTLPQKMWQILTSRNPIANFHVHEPFLPSDYPDRESYTETVHRQYLDWQEKYLL